MTLSIFQLPISIKVPATIIGSVVAVAITTGVLSVYMSSVKFSEEAQARLSAVAAEKSASVERYLASLDQDIATVATNRQTLNALNAFQAAWQAIGSNQEQKLQRAYIEDNPHPLGEKEKLDAAPVTNAYNAAHADFHPWFRQFLYERGYYDIFLFNNDGDLIYSVFKELDYATNLESGKYKNSDLGNAFRAARDGNPKDLHFFDFEPYAPSHGAPAAFLSTSIQDSKGNDAGVLVFQMPIDELNAAAGNAIGLGETGDTYLVGEDFLLRSDAAQTEENDILQTSFENAASRAALAGESGQLNVEIDGAGYFVGYAPLKFHNAQFAMIAKQSSDEALAAVGNMIKQLMIEAIILIAVFAALGLAMARSITRPMNAVIASMDGIAAGNLDQPIQGSNRTDEVGQIAQALEVFKSNAIESKRLETEQKQKDEDATALRRSQTLRLADAFEKQIGEVAKTLSSATNQLEQDAIELANASQETNSQIAGVSSTSETSAIGADAIANATSEMSTASREIAQQVQATSTATRQAAETTQMADE